MKFLVYGLSTGWGGVEAIVMGMISRLSKEHSFDIILPEGECTYSSKHSDTNIHFLHIPAWGSNRNGFRRALTYIMQQTSYDYVWINACLMSNRDIISVAKKYSAAKIITHSHGSSFEEDNKLRRMVLMAMHYMNRHYYHQKTEYPCMCSEKSGEWYYGKKFMQNHEVYNIKNGIDVGKYRYNENVREEYRTKLGLTDELALFHAGRLTFVKNQRFILEIVAELKKKGKVCKLFIAGEGELLPDLKNYAVSLKIDEQVVFLGNRSDVDKLYQAMDIFLLPSHHEGFPVTLTEAQATGIHCMVSNLVSDETNLTGDVDYLPIDSAISQWTDRITNYRVNTSFRAKLADAVIESGYDIKDVCEHFIQHITES